MRALKLIGLGLLWLLLLAYFTYLRFPYGRARPLIDQQLARLGVTGLEYGAVTSDGRGGLSFRDVSYAPARPGRDALPPLSAERVDVRPSLLALVKRQPGARFDVHTFGGRIHGTATFPRNADSEVDVTVDGVDLAEVPYPERGQLEGRLDGTVELAMREPSLRGAAGTIHLEAADGTVHPFKTARGSSIPPKAIAFEQIEADVELQAGNAEVTKLAIEGPEVHLDATGTLGLRPRLEQSSVDADVAVRFGDELALFGDLLGATGARGDRTNGYAFKLRGTLSGPRITSR